MAVDGGDLKGVPQAQTVELINVRIHSAHRVAFVHSQGHRLPGPLQNRGNGTVRSCEAHLYVRHHDDGVRQLDANLCLAAHELENLTVCPRLNAAGIHQVKGTAPPLAGAVNPVPGHAWGVLHNGGPLTGQFIEEHGFAHIGAANNGHQRSWHMESLLYSYRFTKSFVLLSHICGNWSSILRQNAGWQHLLFVLPQQRLGFPGGQPGALPRQQCQMTAFPF